MGWLYTQGATRSDIVQRLVAPWTWEDSEGTHGWRTLKHCTRGNVLWTVHERTLNGEPNTGTPRLIGCYLLQRDPGFGWGYKDMDETMGPYYFTCPLSYLELAGPTENEQALKWRAEVRRRAS